MEKAKVPGLIIHHACATESNFESKTHPCSPSFSFILSPLSFIPYPSSLILHPFSFILSPLSPNSLLVIQAEGFDQHVHGGAFYVAGNVFLARLEAESAFFFGAPF